MPDPESEIFINTVTGKIPVGHLGVTLFHEHLFQDMRRAYIVPKDQYSQELKDKKVGIEDLALIRKFPYSCLDNCVLDDPQIAAEEVVDFLNYGGKTIIEVTAWNCGRLPELLYQVSRDSNIQIIMGTGLYLEWSYPEWVKKKMRKRLLICLSRKLSRG